MFMFIFVSIFFACWLVAVVALKENDLIPPFLPVSGMSKSARLLSRRLVLLSDSDCDGQ